MKFEIKYARAVMGNNIDVLVGAEGSEQIARVVTTLDNFGLGDDTLPGNQVSYQRSFLQAGSASPHMAHTVEVVVTDQNGAPKSATRKWQDAI